MLIKDTEVQDKHREVRKIEETHEINYTAALGKARDRGHVGTVTNRERQMGTALDATVFMCRVRKLNPSLVLVSHPHQPGYANIFVNVLGVREYTGIACEDGVMPEWTVMGTREERVPIENRPGTYWSPVKTLGRVEVRGWRDVLIKLIHKGYLSLEAVEKEFGAGDRHSWAVLTGKHKGQPQV